MMLHRMPARMSPLSLQRGAKSVVTLRAGRVPQMDGQPTELTKAELAWLRGRGIVPTEQARPRPFVARKVPAVRKIEGDGWSLVKSPDEQPEPAEPEGQPLARIKLKRVPKSEALP